MKVDFIGDNYMDNEKSYLGLEMKKHTHLLQCIALEIAMDSRH